MLALGCHSIPLRAPVGSTPAAESKWVKDYKRARSISATEPAEACKLFTSLSQEAKFPAAPLASLRAWETCEPNQSPNLTREQMPPWLQDMALEVALAMAAKSGDKSAEMELAMEKSKQRLTQSEKLKWAQLSLDRARELNNEDKIAEYTKRVYTIAPRLNPEPQVKQFLSVANDYRLSRQFAKAREYYEKVLASDAFRLDDKVAALKGIRLSYKNARNNDAHIAASLRTVDYLRKAEKLNPKSQAVRMAAYDAEIYHARAIWTLGHSSEAKKIFDGIEKRYKGKLSLAELYWLRGRMAEEGNDLKEVSRWMEEALKERITNQDLRDKILWYNAWNERRQKNLPRAAEILAELDEKTQAEFTRERALFWLGKTYAELNQPEQAKPVFDRLIEMDSLGYYGLLAHRHLGLAISFKSNGASTAENSESLPLDNLLADWLVQLEEREALAELLEQTADAYKKQKDQTDDGWVALFRMYARGGLYQKLYETLGSLTTERRRTVVETHPELMFPQPWNEDVKMAALQFSVGEELIYAIMRQESAFDPRARSGADAFGLMQILPEVAESISRDVKVPYAQMEDLYNPKTNIYLGAAHVRELLQRYKGQFILAVASYNASDSAIRGWLKTRFRGDALEFIEEIPYEETRVYVRLVMRNLIFYSLLKSKSASIEFPAWVLALDAS